MEAVCVALVSGKGGTGKSTSSVLVGGALTARGNRVLLIELDNGLRSVDIIAGVSRKTVYDLEDVLTGRCTPAKAVVQSPLYRGLWIISASYSEGVIPVERLELLCTKLRPFFTYILLDTAAGIGDAYRAAVQVADESIIVITPDPVALRDGRIVANDLEERQVPSRLLLNRVNRNFVLRGRLIRDLDEAIDIVGVQLLGVVPESYNIYMSGLHGQRLPKGSMESSVYAAIAGRIEGERVPLVFK